MVMGHRRPSLPAVGSMRRSCERAVRIGLPGVAFTEHLDFDGWRIDDQDATETIRPLINPDGVLRPPVMDVAGYLNCVDRCRREFSGLRILTGVEYGQPHLFDDQAARLPDLSSLDRVNGSLQNGADRSEPMTLFRLWPWIPQWWSEEGGRSITFGSDAHSPDRLADGLPEAAAMVEHFGSATGRRPENFWTR